MSEQKKKKLYGKPTEKKVSDIKNESAYRVCLCKTENAEVIEGAWKKNDFGTIEKMMRKCNVPDKEMKKIMIEILDCKDNKPEVWV